jgi:hypothetical protein
VSCSISAFSRRTQDVEGLAMAQAVSRRPLIAEARVLARVSPCGICDGQNVALG